MGILSDQQIRELSQSGDLIKPFEDASVQGASYDMRLGSHYIRRGTVQSLTEDQPTLTIETGEFYLLSTLETLKLPNNIIGHNGIMSTWAKRGLVSLFSPQIDPGFEGFLIVPVFNAGESPVSINLNAQIFTIEFAEMSKPASYLWTERFQPQHSMPSPVSPNTSLGELSQLPEIVASLAEAKSKIDDQSIHIKALWGTLALIGVVAGIIISLIVSYNLALVGAQSGNNDLKSTSSPMPSQSTPTPTPSQTP